MPSIVIETFRNRGEPSSALVRARPYSGQFDRDYRVWCFISQRESARLGALFLVHATWVKPKLRDPYLRVGLKDPWEPLTITQARVEISKLQGRKLRVPS